MPTKVATPSLKMEVKYVPLTQVAPDKNQPRKYFDEVKLGVLSNSIKLHGILEPLTVEVNPLGGYTLVDGERRYRSAKALGLKELPVIIRTPLKDEERIIEQFHIQEMREGWRPDEKAVAIKTLADTIGCSFAEAAKVVGISKKTAAAYQALMSMHDSATFIAHNLKTEHASYVTGAVNTAAHQVASQLGTEMTDKDKEKLEAVIVNRMVIGELSKAEQFRVIRDTFVKDAKNVEKFIKGANAVDLFNASGAGDVRAYRRLRNMMYNLNSATNVMLRSSGGVKLLANDTEFKSLIKNNVKLMTQLSSLTDGIITS